MMGRVNQMKSPEWNEQRTKPMNPHSWLKRDSVSICQRNATKRFSPLGDFNKCVLRLGDQNISKPY